MQADGLQAGQVPVNEVSHQALVSYLSGWITDQTGLWAHHRAPSEIAWEWLRDPSFVRIHLQVCNILNSSQEPAAEAILRATGLWPATPEFAVLVDALELTCGRSRVGQVAAVFGLAAAILVALARSR